MVDNDYGLVAMLPCRRLNGGVEFTGLTGCYSGSIRSKEEILVTPTETVEYDLRPSSFFHALSMTVERDIPAEVDLMPEVAKY